MALKVQKSRAGFCGSMSDSEMLIHFWDGRSVFFSCAFYANLLDKQIHPRSYIKKAARVFIENCFALTIRKRLKHNRCNI